MSYVSIEVTIFNGVLVSKTIYVMADKTFARGLYFSTRPGTKPAKMTMIREEQFWSPAARAKLAEDLHEMLEGSETRPGIREISNLLTEFHLTIVFRMMPLSKWQKMPTNWWRFFVDGYLPCQHEEAKFVRTALMCPSCGFVGGF